MAFYSDLCIVPADGLMMDYSFNDDVIKLGIMEYFQLNHSQSTYLGPIGYPSSEDDVKRCQEILFKAPFVQEARRKYRDLPKEPVNPESYPQRSDVGPLEDRTLRSSNGPSCKRGSACPMNSKLQ